MKWWIDAFERAAWQTQAINCHHWHCQVALGWMVCTSDIYSGLKSPRVEYCNWHGFAVEGNGGGGSGSDANDGVNGKINHIVDGDWIEEFDVV